MTRLNRRRGGNLAYGELCLAMTRHFAPAQLAAILASPEDLACGIDLLGERDYVVPA